MHFVTQTAQGQAASRNITTGQNFLFLITSQLKNKLIPV